MGLASNSSDRGLQRPARCWGPRRGSCERDQRSNGRSDAAWGEIAWAPCFACSRLRGPDQVGGLAAPDDPRSSVSELPCPHSLMRSPATHLGVCMHDCPASCPCHPTAFTCGLTRWAPAPAAPLALGIHRVLSRAAPQPAARPASFMHNTRRWGEHTASPAAAAAASKSAPLLTSCSRWRRSRPAAQAEGSTRNRD